VFLNVPSHRQQISHIHLALTRVTADHPDRNAGKISNLLARVAELLFTSGLLQSMTSLLRMNCRKAVTPTGRSVELRLAKWLVPDERVLLLGFYQHANAVAFFQPTGTHHCQITTLVNTIHAS